MPPSIQKSVKSLSRHYGLSLPQGKRKSPTKFKTLIETKNYPFKTSPIKSKKLSGKKIVYY